MRSTLASGMMGLVVWMIASPLGAQSLAYEGFDYPTNLTLINQTATGDGFSGDWRMFTGGNSATVVTNSLSYVDLNGRSVYLDGNHAQVIAGGTTGRNLDTNSTGLFGLNGYIDGNGNIGADGETLYASFLFQYVYTDGQYSSPFTLGRDGDADGNQVFRVETSQDNRLALNGMSEPPTYAYLTSGVVDTNTHFLVLKLVFNSGNDSVYAYLDPTNLLAEPTVATGSLVDASDFSFDRLSIGDWQGANNPFIDEYRFGGSWISVIPEPGTSAVAALMLLTALGMRAVRRRGSGR